MLHWVLRLVLRRLKERALGMCLRELVVQVVKVQFFHELFLVVGLGLFAKISLDLEVPGLAE